MSLRCREGVKEKEKGLGEMAVVTTGNAHHLIEGKACQGNDLGVNVLAII